MNNMVQSQMLQQPQQVMVNPSYQMPTMPNANPHMMPQNNRMQQNANQREIMNFIALSTPRISWVYSSPLTHFIVLGPAISGAFGDVYKAQNKVTRELAAIKEITLEPGDDFSVIQQEIIMMKDCKHSNIVAYFGSYLWDKLWIAMEYCGGGSIHDIYRDTGSLEERQIAYVCRETLKGLVFLHSKGKIHRDIKGSNILLTDEGVVKLADFGVSAEITQTMAKRNTRCGTPIYMAPEVAAAEYNGGYDQKCDIWSLGVTAIELAGQQRWSGEFSNFLECALKKNPNERPTAENLLEHPFVSQGGLSAQIGLDLIDKAKKNDIRMNQQQMMAMHQQTKQIIDSTNYTYTCQSFADNLWTPGVGIAIAAVVMVIVLIVCLLKKNFKMQSSPSPLFYYFSPFPSLLPIN